MPTNLLCGGQAFGVWEAIDRMVDRQANTNPSWSVTSGARSVHLLLHKKQLQCDRIRKLLRKHSIRFSEPEWNELERDSWPLVREIAKEADTDWHVEILVIPWDLVDGDDEAALSLQNYFLKQGWTQSEHLRNAPDIEASIQGLYLEQKTFKINLGHGHIPHLRRIIAIGQGNAMTFTPVHPGGSAKGPFIACQEFLREAVKPYLPAMLEPTYLDKPGSRGYYSASLAPIYPPPLKKGRGWLTSFHEQLFKLWVEEHAPRSGYTTGAKLSNTLRSHGLDWLLYGKPTGIPPHEDTLIEHARLMYNFFCPSAQCIDPQGECFSSRTKALLKGTKQQKCECASCPVKDVLHCDHEFFEACVEIERL